MVGGQYDTAEGRFVECLNVASLTESMVLLCIEVRYFCSGRYKSRRYWWILFCIFDLGDGGKGGRSMKLLRI